MERIAGWLQLVGLRGWQLGGVAVAVWVFAWLFRTLVVFVLVLFVAAVLITLLSPVARWLEARGLPPSLAAAVSVVGTVLLGVGAVALVAGQLATAVPELRSEYDEVVQQVRGWLTDGPLGLDEQQVDEAQQAVVERVQGNWREIARQTIAVLSGLGGLLAAIVLAYFGVRDGETLRAWVLRRLVSEQQHDLVVAAGRRALSTFRGYVKAVVLIGALDATLIGIGLFVLGVPLAGALVALTFLGGFFPVVGATAAGALATLVAGVSGGLTDAVIIAVIVLAVQQVDGNLLQPVIMGREVHLHPAVVLAALTLGGLLGGLPGALLAVPTLSVLVAAGAAVREHRDQDALLAQRADDTAGVAT